MAKKKALVVPMIEKVEIWPIERLKAYAKNPNKHPEEQITKIASSIREFGFLNPIIVCAEREEIVAGEGRYRAAQRLGLEHVPVLPETHLTDEQRRLFVIADNRIARDSMLDEHLLAVEIADLRNAGANINIAGFTEDEIKKLVGDGSAPSANVPGMAGLGDLDGTTDKKKEPEADVDDLTIIAHPTNYKQQLEVLNTLRGLGVLCEAKGQKASGSKL